jgi:hypothetical protein
MRRSASEIINELEMRVAQLEKQSRNSNTPIAFTLPNNGPTDYLNLSDVIREAQKMYDMGQSIQGKDGQFRPAKWDSKDLEITDDEVLFQVSGARGSMAQRASKTDLCKAMCESGLLDKAIKSFLMKQLDM